MTRVKICGIKTVDEARAALACGADMLGFVFYRPVPRYVQPEVVAEIVRTCRTAHASDGRTWHAVGVFVNEPAEAVNAICRVSDLDLVQLCGEEDAAYCARLERPAIKVLRAGSAAWTAERLRQAQHGYAVERFMVDSHVEGFYGGTGVAADWDGLTNLLDDQILAGGLRPDNVAGALAVTHAWGVDVSSGVEREGRKDPELIRAFIDEVRAFDHAS